MTKIKYKGREFKGENLLEFPTNYTVIDIETTGLDPEYDDIIEISALKVRENKVTDSFSTLVKIDYELDEFITELTGITDEMLKTGMNLTDALSKFVYFIDNDILIGHNVHFDINFLYDKCNDYLSHKLSNNFVDTLRLSRYALPELKHHRLIDLIDYYSINTSTFHRGLADCKSTYKVYLKIKSTILTKFGSIETLKRKYTKSIRASDFVADSNDIDTSNPFYQKECIFTGTLKKMSRREAMQLIANLGGINRNTVTKNTNYLVLGNNDYNKKLHGNKSNKIKTAEEYKLKGQEIEMISENIFYDMIEDYIIDKKED